MWTTEAADFFLSLPEHRENLSTAVRHLFLTRCIRKDLGGGRTRINYRFRALIQLRTFSALLILSVVMPWSFIKMASHLRASVRPTD